MRDPQKETKVTFRIPWGLSERLAHKANLEHRSMNSQLIIILEAALADVEVPDDA